jgi:transposase InsO family protein
MADQSDFAATGPDQKWAADISYIWTTEGWLYLAIVLDLYSRRNVRWAVRECEVLRRLHPLLIGRVTPAEHQT